MIRLPTLLFSVVAISLTPGIISAGIDAGSIPVKSALEVSSTKLTHGGIFVAKVFDKEAKRIKIKSSVFPLFLGKNGDMSGVIVGVPSWWDNGAIYEVVLDGKPTGTKLEITGRVAEKETLTIEKSKLETNEETGKQYKVLSGVITSFVEEKYWSGKFILPVESRISTGYGTGRTVNGATGGIHRGVDIAANEGVEVKATNDGLVTLSRKHFSTGNTIVINHGTGIVSVYYHMSELIAKENSKVIKGDVIGKVGSTGVSTGAHLHWGIWIFGVDVDPLELAATDWEY